MFRKDTASATFTVSLSKGKHDFGSKCLIQSKHVGMREYVHLSEFGDAA